VLRARHRRAAGDVQPAVLEQALRHHLVHGQRGGQHPRAHVGDPQDLEQSLQRAILAPRSVQGDEGDVDGRLALRRDDRARRRYERLRGALDLPLELGRELPPVALGEGVDPAGPLREGLGLRALLRAEVAVVGHERERIHQDGFVAVGRQVLGDLQARGERDLPLGGRAAGQDAHADAPGHAGRACARYRSARPSGLNRKKESAMSSVATPMTAYTSATSPVRSMA
jgi:hypothetical protein